jgi:hypothetical protein
MQAHARMLHTKNCQPITCADAAPTSLINLVLCMNAMQCQLSPRELVGKHLTNVQISGVEVY